MNDLLNNLIEKYTHNTFMVYCNDVVSDLEQLKQAESPKVPRLIKTALKYEVLESKFKQVCNLSIQETLNKIVEDGLLPNPEMVEIPEYIEEWVLLCKGLGCGLGCAMTTKLRDTSHETLAKKVKAWLAKEKNENIFAIAWTTGSYRVAKEQLYQVPILETDNDRKLLVKVAGEFDIKWQSENEGYWQEDFPIGDIPEKYRLFAEKAGEEE